MLYYIFPTPRNAFIFLLLHPYSWHKMFSQVTDKAKGGEEKEAARAIGLPVGSSTLVSYVLKTVLKTEIMLSQRRIIEWSELEGIIKRT